MDEQEYADDIPGEMDTSFIMLHEIFVSLMAAGFTEKQALAIITGIVTTKREDEPES